MGNTTGEQMCNAIELESNIRNLILCVAGNHCRICGNNFIPYKKNDEICNNCYSKVDDLEYCPFCESVIISNFNHCCRKCFEKHKRICSRCRKWYTTYQNGKCGYCQ